ncbi:MAG: hypothetical protein GX646_03125 [Bacteroidales bacterium]|nr:hypothetical protein [Bacteroidales bacterium]
MTDTEKLNQALIEDLAERELKKLNPSLGGSPLTDKAIKYFLSEIRSRRWELGRGRQVTPLTETGAVLSDAHGWPVSFQDVIKSIAGELFDLPEQASTPERMSEEQYISAMQKAETPEQRIKLMQEWQRQQYGK